MILGLVNELCVVVGLGILGIRFIMFKVSMTFFYRTVGRIKLNLFITILH